MRGGAWGARLPCRTGGAASGGELGQRRGRGGTGGGGGGDSERGGGTRGVVTHGLLALGPFVCFFFVWRVMSGVCAVRFPSVFSPWIDNYSFVSTFLAERGDEDAAIGTADRKRIK